MEESAGRGRVLKQMQQTLKKTGAEILQWYKMNKRDLPWRHTHDPYRIWVSEIMLQQTRVDIVIDYYARFLERFPDIASLAAADEQEVLNCWKGLGYYTRAKNLHKATKVIADQWGGAFPGTYEEIVKVPGIGPYTAGAVSSIAFSLPYPAVDGNVLRVVSRITGSREDIGKEKTKKLITEAVMEMMIRDEVTDFNQSLMELGALICIPANPRCLQCPVWQLCTACREGMQEEIPVKKKKDAVLPEQDFIVAVIRDNQALLLEFRKEESLLGQMWGFPLVEKTAGAPPEKLLRDKYGFDAIVLDKLGDVSHVFSHRIWRMDVREFVFKGSEIPGENLRWILLKEIRNTAIPTAFGKVLDLLPEQAGMVAEQEEKYR